MKGISLQPNLNFCNHSCPNRLGSLCFTTRRVHMLTVFCINIHIYITQYLYPEYAHKRIVVGANSLSGNSNRKLLSDIMEYTSPVSNIISTGKPSKVISTLIGGMELGDCKVYNGHSSVSSSSTVNIRRGLPYFFFCTITR